MEILVTESFEQWIRDLDDQQQQSVLKVVTYLEIKGLALGHPHSSNIEGTKLPLRELRPQAGRSPLRVFYAFDPNRDAVLLLGGDKSNDKKFYKRMIRTCEAIWEEFLRSHHSG